MTKLYWRFMVPFPDDQTGETEGQRYFSSMVGGDIMGRIYAIATSDNGVTSKRLLTLEEVFDHFDAGIDKVAQLPGAEEALNHLVGTRALLYWLILSMRRQEADEQSARNVTNRTEKGVTLEAVRETLKIYRKKRLAEMEANPLAKYPEIGWKSGLAKAFNIKSYAHTLKPKLLGLGITEAQIVAYLKTGQWW